MGFVRITEHQGERIAGATRWVEDQRVDKRQWKRKSSSAPSIKAYKATADESGDEITVQAVNANGTVTGDEITLKVLP